ncbi:MAG: DUF6427 family protein [Polaribacter sp.]
MLTNFLAKSKPINFIIYLGLFLCFFLIAVISIKFNDGFTWFKLLETSSFFAFFLAIFFFYSFIVSKNKLTFDHSYGFFLFTLLSILFISKILAFKTLLLLLIYLLFLRKIYSLRSPKKVIQKLFDSGFWLGVLCILEPYLILFSILIFTSILLQQKITFRTLLTPVIGFFAPIIIYFTYLFWNDNLEGFLQLLQLDITNTLFIYAKDSTIWIFATTILLTICSLFLKSPKALSVNNSFKRSWLLLITNLSIAVLFALVITDKDGSEVIFLTIPASIIIANGFEVIQKKWIKNVLLWILVITTIFTFFQL